MNYELAKQLKDAGFLQKNDFPGYIPGTNAEIDLFLKNHPASIPTLEELIEACQEFNMLRKHDDFWSAHAAAGYGEGPTAVVATANLWLALNKN